MIVFISFLKLLIVIFFSSDFQLKLFLPFLNNTLENFPSDPWLIAIQNGQYDSFPYHPLMLYLLIPFQAIPFYFHLSDIWTRVALVFPSFLADLIILYILKAWFPNRNKAILLIYFCSPILLYSIYSHGQLDLIPTSLLFLSLYFLLKKQFIHSGLSFGLALSMKLHVLAAVSMFLFFIFRKDKSKLVSFSLSFLITFSLISLPWYFSSSFRDIVLLNPKQELLFSSIYKIGEYQLVVPFFATTLIYLKFFSYRNVNPELLVTWLAILFSVFVLTIPPAPGWYVWILPFLVYFYLKFVKKERHTIYLSSLLNIAFLIFFLFSWKGDYVDLRFLNNEFLPKIENSKLNGILFTFLSASLLANLYAIYGLGVRSNRIYHKPSAMLIGIGGDSGAGKSTLLHSLAKLFHHSVTLLEGDGDHRWERGHENYNKFTHLDPRANYLERQAENLYLLKKGEKIFRPDYDHITGNFTEPQPIQPSEYIILSGLHTFYLPKMRKVMDLKIFIDTEDKLRNHWKILRDTEKRGYSKEKILKQISDRENDSIKFIQPQKEYADISIEYFSINSFELGNPSEHIQVGLKLTMLSEFSVEPIAVALEENDLILEWNYVEDLKRQYFIFHNPVSSEKINLLLEHTLANIEDLVPEPIQWDSGYNGIVQFFTLAMVHQKLRESFEGI